MKKAVILFAHGSMDPLWREPFERLRERVQENNAGIPVMLAYMQFSPPALADALSALKSRGAGEVLVIPLFLSAGGHMRHDLPEIKRKAIEAFPSLSLVFTDILGSRPEVQDAFVLAIQSMLSGA
ncbi:MAG: CbiX/SirB N-terminal domain-containing protein [Candidatus Eremiobacteraeota bacterium]|nr:CbiX/SirB N-terminal domain-containing protein [Candidatus Eremiobacteraeota bacterium]